MRRARSKKLAIMILFTFMATLFAAVPMASAAASYSASTVSKVSSEDNQPLGSIRVTVPVADMDDDYFFTLRLPTDFDFNLGKNLSNAKLTQVGSSELYSINNAKVSDAVYFRIPVTKNAAKGQGAAFEVTTLADNEIKILVKDTIKQGDTNEKEAYFYIDLKKINVDSGYSGDIEVLIEGESGSPFVSSKVVVASVGTGTTELSIDSVDTITTSIDEIGNIRLKEDRPGAFKGTDTIKLKLPSGFKWKSWSNIAVTPIDGAAIFNIQGTADDDRTLVIDRLAATTNKACYVMLQNLKIEVDDETVAKMGDVEVTVSGTASATPSSLVVAKYGEYDVKAYAVGDPKVVYAGRTGQSTDDYTEIGKFAIEEVIKGSLVPERTVTLQLVGGAKWVKDGDYNNEGKWVVNDNDYVKDIKIATADSKNYSDIFSTGGVEWKVIGNARDTAKFTLGNEKTTSACKAVFERAKISISADADEEIKLVVGGTAGVTGEFVVAKVERPVTAAVDGSIPNLIIGQQTIELPPIVVTEADKEAIDAGDSKLDKSLRLEFPAGVLPTKPTKVEVDGDLQLDMDSVCTSMSQSNNLWGVDVKVKATSSNASSITFSGINVTTDRTVPEGELVVKVKGDSVVQNGNDFPGSKVAASAAVANCVTPAPTDKKATAVFTIGETAYTLNGAEMTMDVAPYIKNDRTFLPVRFVSNAVGVADDNILWNDATKTVTILKGDRTVQMTINSKIMKVNGADIAIDVAPEIKSDRTMLPIRALSTALGCEILWDDATRTVTINY